MRRLFAGLVLVVALAALATPATAVDASLDGEQPVDNESNNVVLNPPVQLSVDVSTTGEVAVEFRDQREAVIDEQVVTNDTTVSTTWDPDVGTHAYHVVVRSPDGVVLDATTEHELTVTNRNPDAACLEAETELRNQDIPCAIVGTFTGSIPLPVFGMILWGALSLGLFVRTGSPMMPYVLLLLTGGAVSSMVAGPMLSLITVFGLAVTGGVPLLLYVKYAR